MSLALIDEMRCTGVVHDLRPGEPPGLDGLLASREGGFIVDSSHAMVERAYELTERVIAHAGIDGEDGERMGIACREAINNAQRHGNRWLEERLICIHFMRDGRKLVVSVADEGGGFDFAAYVREHLGQDAVEAARQRYRSGGMGGLGLKMMLECCDRVLYDAAGGAYLVKHLGGARPGEAARFDLLQSDPRGGAGPRP